MSAPEAKNPPSAGISSPDDLDVAALFEQLRAELRRGVPDADARGAEFAAARALAERFWPVTAEREAGGGPKGFVKRFLRKLMRWYIEPLAADQRVFNDSLLKLVDLRDAAPVLDVGCGRGELLELLRAEGVESRGIDADADMVAYAQGEGLDVQQADLVEYLEGLDDGELGGIFMGQVVEHLPPGVLVRAFELAAAKLRPGGVLIAETINPLSPLALRHYFADLTHAQPLVPETLELLAHQAGFAYTELRFLNEPAERLAEPDDPVIAANVRRLNELLFAPLDYALVARTA